MTLLSFNIFLLQIIDRIQHLRLYFLGTWFEFLLNHGWIAIDSKWRNRILCKFVHDLNWFDYITARMLIVPEGIVKHQIQFCDKKHSCHEKVMIIETTFSSDWKLFFVQCISLWCSSESQRWTEETHVGVVSLGGGLMWMCAIKWTIWVWQDQIQGHSAQCCFTLGSLALNIWMQSQESSAKSHIRCHSTSNIDDFFKGIDL